MRFTVDFTNRSEPTRGLAGNPFIHPSYVYSLLSVWGLCEDLGCQDERNRVTGFEGFTLYYPKLSCSINNLLQHRESALLAAQSYQTLWPHRLQPARLLWGILQAKLLEWIAIPSSRGYSWLRDWTWVSCTAGRFFTISATREDHDAVKWKSPSRVWLFVTQWTTQSMEFSRPEYWSSLCLLQGIFPTQGSNPGLPHCRWLLYQLSQKGSPTMQRWVLLTEISTDSVGAQRRQIELIRGLRSTFQYRPAFPSSKIRKYFSKFGPEYFVLENGLAMDASKLPGILPLAKITVLLICVLSLSLNSSFQQISGVLL